MMDPIVEPFTGRVRQVDLNPPQIPYLSNVTGDWITAEQATDPGYWAGHVRQTVRFDEGLQKLLQEPEQVLLEVGPGRVLNTLAIRHPDKLREQVTLSSVRHPKEKIQSDTAFLLTTLGKLWLAGVKADWSEFYRHERRHRVPLPTYPFERKRHWIAPPINKASASGAFQAPENTEAEYPTEEAAASSSDLSSLCCSPKSDGTKDRKNMAGFSDN